MPAPGKGTAALRFYTDEELLEKLHDEPLALARFGDGEFAVVQGIGGPNFQAYDNGLQTRLREILYADHPNVMIAVPVYLNDTSMLHYYSKAYWEAYIAEHQAFIRSLDTGKIYANTGVTRPYIDLADRSRCSAIFDQFKRLWHNRRVLIVEGRKTRFGVNNDLLHGASVVHRILCPETDAYGSYDVIKHEVMRIADRYDLILAALGPTATVLCYDLGIQQCQAIDIGHLDIEYEWYRKKAVWKVQVGNKYVNEARRPYIETSELDPTYYDSIIGEIVN